MGIKVGDWVVFQVKAIDHNGFCASLLGDGGVDSKNLTKIPPPDPLQSLKDKLLREVMAIDDDDYYRVGMGHIAKCKNDIIDAQRPPDLVAELRRVANAATALLSSAGVKCTADDLEAAVSALETERGRRKPHA